MSSYCLVSIVKNEGHIIARLLTSVKDLVVDYCILDTGSTDDTINQIQSFQHVSGTIHHSLFINFEQSRNEALRLAREHSHADYLLLLDADMELIVNDIEHFKAFNKDGMYILQKLGPLEYYNVRIIKRNIPTFYVGVTHEYLDTLESDMVYTDPTIAFIIDQGDGGSKQNKLQRDRTLLEGAESTPRNTFYLAQTYRDLEHCDLAIETYKRVCEMNGWIEEINFSRYMLTLLYLNVKQDIDTAIYYAHLVEPPRPEPFYHICKYYRTQSNFPDAVKYLALARSAIQTQSTKPLFYDTRVPESWLPLEEYLLWHIIHNTHQDFTSLFKYLTDENKHNMSEDELVMIHQIYSVFH